MTDRLFETEALYVEAWLLPEQVMTYRSFRAQYGLAEWVLVPDAVILLQAGPAALVQRIRQCGRGDENEITQIRVEEVRGSFEAFFRDFDVAPILRLAASGYGLASGSSGLVRVLDRVEQWLSLLHAPNRVWRAPCIA